MSALQDALLLLVAAGGTVVALTRDPRRQAVAVSLYGLLLGMLFFAVQAPDVALSQIAVGTVALPILILLTLGKLREERNDRRGGRG